MQLLSLLPFLCLAYAAPSSPYINILREANQAIMEAGSESKATGIEFDACDSTRTVTHITVAPCDSGNGTFSSPCQFVAGHNYTITLTFTSPADSSDPRANLIAQDPTQSAGPGSENYPYSGQSFDACEYTSCPIQQNVTAQYTYNFVTLNSPFDKLTFNTTDGLEGQSLLCASFPVAFKPALAGRTFLPRLPFGGLRSRQQ